MLQDYKNFADILASDVLSKLEGSHEDFFRFRSVNKPSRSIVIGSLADADVKNNRSKTSVKNNNMSIKFLLKEMVDSIEVIPSFYVFYRVFPTFEEQISYVTELKDDNDKHDFAKVWKRKEFKGDPISLNYLDNDVELDLSKFIDEIYEDDLLFTATNNDEITCNDEKGYYAQLENFKGRGQLPNFEWKCKLYLNHSELFEYGEILKLIEIGIVNLTEKGKFETFLFNCHLEIDLKTNELRPFHYSYEENDQKKIYTNKLRTINCHAILDDENKINTIHYSRYESPMKSPCSEKDGFQATFEKFISDDCIESLEQLYGLMDNFEKKCEIDLDNTFEFKSFENSKENFLKGINCLKTNDDALKAFKLMNESFLNNSKGNYSSWRLFQIVFIVSMIPEIVDKSSSREYCDLLHVMTGGGKSESYFGIVIFTVFYDRLIGKTFGVSAITKFPLRMLSIQQLQRISSLFIWAEKIRVDNKIKGHPFTVAYYVGNQDDSTFPKDNVEIIEHIRNNDEVPGKIISVCPICGEKVFLTVDEDKSLIMHQCSGCKQKFGLFYTDYEIFRVLPTFIVSTVDKLASISIQQRVKNIFGGKIDECSNGHGFLVRKGECDVKGCSGEIRPVNVDFNTGPSLIIQDEMHLVKEGFGTIDSHFETLYEAFSYECNKEHLKYIVMTATVNGAEKQVKELYNKKLRIFPPSLKDIDGEEFFFEYPEENDSPIINRQIIGLKPNNIDNNSAIILSLRYVSEFIKSVEEDMDFANKLGVDQESFEKIVGSFKSMLSYHLKVSDVHNTRNFVGRNINDSNFDIYRINSMTLTGADDLEDIKEVMRQIEDFDEKGQKKLQLTSATNIVSHGVDLNKWNLMFFQGIPRSTSEYIQALSRVGRKFHGLIFLWFYPNRVRDLSFYQNFNEYHKILPYKVEKVPIARWTKLGFKQTFTSIFNAAVINYLSNVLEKPCFNLKEVNRALNNKNNRQMVIDFIKNAYVVDNDDMGADYFRENIEIEVDKRINYLRDYKGDETSLPYVLEDSPYTYFKTQTGMRGIQDNINVKRNLPICYR